MILNLGSLAFNANIAAGGGTPAWGTELGQGEGYKFMFEDMSDFFTGMVYSSVADIENVTCPLGKGGNARNDFEFVIASHFKKIYVNNHNVPNAQFILLVIKKLVGDHHVGRRTIKYNPRMTYLGKEINDDCYKKIANTLGLNNDSAWFVHEINILNQDELHFTAYILGEQTMTYSSTEERKKAFLSKLPKDGKKIYVGESNSHKASLQQIYYGAPGTGKSHTINKITEAQPKENVFRTTFHPDSDYSTFVGCYKPTMRKAEMIYSEKELIAKLKGIKESGVTYPCHKFATKYWKSLKDLDVQSIKDILSACGFTDSMNVEVSKGIAIGQELLNASNDSKIVYSFSPQSFTKAYARAWQTDDPVYLVIEEINRGNCAQIFGDLFQLLDRKNCISEYPIKADNDLAQYLAEQFSNNSREDIPEKVKSGDELVLPSNLYIWATMNTSDQSLFPIDSAFKRRWDWKYVPIVQGYDKETGTLLEWKIKVGNKEYDWWKFLQAINKHIDDTTKSEDKKLGYFFCKAENGIISAETFVGKVLFYLWNDVFKDYDHSQAFFRDENGQPIEYGEYYTLDASHNTTPNLTLVQSFIEKVEPGFKTTDGQESDNQQNA